MHLTKLLWLYEINKIPIINGARFPALAATAAVAYSVSPIYQDFVGGVCY